MEFIKQKKFIILLIVFVIVFISFSNQYSTLNSNYTKLQEEYNNIKKEAKKNEEYVNTYDDIVDIVYTEDFENYVNLDLSEKNLPETISSLKNEKSELESSIKKLKNDKKKLKNEKSDLAKEIKDLEKDVISIEGKEKSYSAGEYTVGYDIPKGRYKIYGMDGYIQSYYSNGNLGLNAIIDYENPTYIHEFEFGEKVEASSSFKIIKVQ